GQLRDGVLAHQLDRGSDLLVRLDGDQLRCGAVLLLELHDLADIRRRLAPLEEAELDQVVVVEELREVGTAAVREERDDRLPGPELLRDLDGGPGRGAAGTPDEHPLLACESPRGQERVAVGDRYPPV